jgi:O-acetyl-ADP-ribose deacetylase (regulator of RNase III)
LFKLEFKEPVAVLLVLSVAALVIAIIGTNPLSAPAMLGVWERTALGGLGLLLLGGCFVISHKKQPAQAPINEEFKERLRAAGAKMAEIIPESKILTGIIIGRCKFDVINDSIGVSSAEVIVSSDDNHFGARGGVAKAILEKAGGAVQEELQRYRSQSFRQGQMVITTGGSWGCRAIIHPAVIDLDENRYPDIETIKTIVRRSLSCAVALGAKSVAFPVLGGGTASKHLKPQDSARAIAEEAIAFLEDHRSEDDIFTYVALYVFDKRDADDLPGALLPATQHDVAVPPPLVAGEG